MDILIKGDYLLFVIGNLLADASIALFAVITYTHQKKDRRIASFLRILEIQNKSTTDILEIYESIDFLRDNDLGQLNLTDDEKNYLKKYINEEKRFAKLYKIIIGTFCMGVFIEFLSLIIPRYITV